MVVTCILEGIANPHPSLVVIITYKIKQLSVVHIQISLNQFVVSVPFSLNYIFLIFFVLIALYSF